MLICRQKRTVEAVCIDPEWHQLLTQQGREGVVIGAYYFPVSGYIWDAVSFELEYEVIREVA